MTITCTLKEFANLVRDCHNGACDSCALKTACAELRINEPELPEKNLVEFFCHHQNIIPENSEQKEDFHVSE